jgi:Glycosyltransferase family 87
LLKDSRLGLLLALLFAGSMRFYVQRVLVPYQKADAAAHGRPRGNLSDLYPRWLGTRELLLHHRNPYSFEVTREIQNGYYGRPLDRDRTDDPKDQQGFAYPLHVVFLLAPTVGLPFPEVQTGFRWLLVVLTLASIFLWLLVVRWRPSVAVTAILIVLTFGSYAVVQGIKLQQLTLVVSALIAGCAAALVAGHFALAGFLLALATIKPQLAVPVAVWLGLWAVSNWRRRQVFVWSFGLTTAIFLAASEYVLPGWFGQFREAVAAYRQYTGGAGSLLDVLATPALGKILAGAAVIAVAATGWYVRHASHDSVAFSTQLALVLAVTLVIVPTFAPYNQVLLLPAVFLIATSWKDLWRRSQFARMACGLAWLVVFWPWLASCGLTLASLFLPASSVQRAWTVPLYTSLGIPLVVLGLLAVCARDRLKISSAVDAPIERATSS